MREILKIADHLEKLGTYEIQPVHEPLGICYELCRQFPKFFRSKQSHIDFVYEYAKDWRHYSGYRRFPINHPNRDAREAFDDQQNLWDDSEYADRRRELCLLMANKIRQENK